MSIFPLIKNFKENTFLNAFILASVLNAIIISFTFIYKDYIEKFKMNNILKFIISALYIFFITLISYFIMYLLFGYGNAMIIRNL